MRTEKTGLKAIMRAIIAKRTKQDIAAITQDIAAGHEVRIYVFGSNRIKLDYDEAAGCWEYKVDVYMTIDYSDRHLTVEGLLHASGNTSMMRVYDACNGTEVWALFDGKGTADENRQVEYNAIA